MLAIFHGNDSIRVRESALNFATHEADGEALQLVDADSYEQGTLESLVGEVSLFGDKRVYVLDNLFNHKDGLETLIKSAAALSASANVFVVIEGTLLAPTKSKLGKQADFIEEYKKEGDERFNTFSLADALARKDKKLLWLKWHEALLNGISPEEIAGVLWWQLKTLRLAAITKNAAEAGLKDFPYKKAKSVLAKFAKGELEKLSRTLLGLLHESRLGRQDVRLSIERWILRL